MRTPLSLLVLVILTIAPAAAAPMTGMASMQYYVGTWTCMAGPAGGTQSHATATYVMDSDLMREWIVVPPQGKMKTAYVLSSATTYDAKTHRYVQTWLGNDAGWSVDAAKPWTGNTETWMDTASSTGKLGRSVTVRTNQNGFSFTGYPSATSVKATFKGSCTRST